MNKTPKKNMAELQAMSARELIQLVVERASELQSLEAKYRLLEHDQAEAVNNAFRGLLKRLGIERDRSKLTEDDMYRLITSGLLGWEFPHIECTYMCDICGKPITQQHSACSIEDRHNLPDHLTFHQDCWDAEFGPWPPTEQMIRVVQERFSPAARACVAAAERVMAAFDPRLIGSEPGDDPTDDCEPAFTPPANLDR